MFQFRVDGLTGAAALLDSVKWPTRAISVVAPKLTGWVSRGPHHLVIYMDDVSDPSLSELHPTFEHVEQILEFTGDLTNQDRVLVNCHLGQSRSTAVMMGILYQYGMEPEAAFEAVKAQRPFLLPNLMICQHIDRYYDLPGTFEAIARARFDPEELEARRREIFGGADSPGKPTRTAVDVMQDIIDRMKDQGEL